MRYPRIKLPRQPAEFVVHGELRAVSCGSRMRSSPDGYVEAPIPETDHEAPDYKADLTPAKIMLGRRLFFYVWFLSDSLIAAGAPVKLRHGSVVAM
jgi:hypothetical protein